MSAQGAFPSAPPLASCSVQTEDTTINIARIDDDATCTHRIESPSEIKRELRRQRVFFETTIALLAIVGSVAIACTFALIGVLSKRLDAHESEFGKKLDTFAALRGVELELYDAS